MMWDIAYAWMQSALTGKAPPGVIFFALFVMTFLLEDVAIAAGAALAVDGLLPWELTFVAVAGGIAFGDVGLYVIGRLSHKISWIEHRYVHGRQFKACELLMRRLGSTIMLARAIPGLRLLTYVACGYFRIPLSAFIYWVLLSVSIWTASLFVISIFLGQKINEITGIPTAWAAPSVIGVIALAIPIFNKLFKK